MYLLNQEDLLMVSGANPVYPAVAVGVSTYIGGAAIVDATQTLNNFGHTIGETIYNSTHPDPLGKTLYTAEDFNLNKV